MHDGGKLRTGEEQHAADAFGVQPDGPVTEHCEEHRRQHAHWHQVEREHGRVVGIGTIRAAITLPASMCAMSMVCTLRLSFAG